VSTIGRDRTVSPSCRPAVGENVLYAFKAPGKVGRTHSSGESAPLRGLVLRRRRVINKRGTTKPNAPALADARRNMAIALEAVLECNRWRVVSGQAR
jgi:hypothetical protein